MPCHAITETDVTTVTRDTPLEDALDLMEKQKVSYLPVLDEKKVFLGALSYVSLFKQILPVSVAIAEGVQLDVSIQAAPGMAKRLKKVLPLPVSQFMDSRVPVVYPETTTWEGVKRMVQNGGPVIVVEQETNRFVGVLTGFATLRELKRIQDKS